MTNNDEYPIELLTVVSTREASRMWGFTQKHLIKSADMGVIVGRKSGGIWLLYVPSLIEKWGKPSNPLRDGDLENV